MKTLDRTIAPSFKNIEKINIQHAVQGKLSNGIPVYSVNAGSQELTKIEFLFKAGVYYQDSVLIASAANNLLETGTSNYTANELSDKIDFYGSFFECNVGQDYSSLALYSLNKYLENTLVYIEDVIKNATFPKDEFDIYLSNKKQKHLVNSQKVSVVSRRKFNELIYGEKHPYGIDVKTEDFENLSIDAVKEFYHTHYNSNNCIIMLSGKLPDNILEILERHFGQTTWGKGTAANKTNIEAISTNNRINLIKKDDAIQSAIRIGRLLFNKTHKDYYNFQVLNTILGGYFGSRLMANIREDKGFTYGIGSGLTSNVRSGCFVISTEVGVDVTQQAIDEIYKEIKILQTDLVGAEELETVKNYILGQFLRSVDGPFALAEKFKAIWEFGLDYSYYENYFAAVKNVTANQLRDLANQYLQQDDLIECIVGNK